jgi:hypothetical protein
LRRGRAEPEGVLRVSAPHALGRLMSVGSAAILSGLSEDLGQPHSHRSVRGADRGADGRCCSDRRSKGLRPCAEPASTDPLQRHTPWIPWCPLLGLRDRFTSIQGRRLKSQIRKSGDAYHDWVGSTGAYEVRIQFAERVPGASTIHTRWPA